MDWFAEGCFEGLGEFFDFTFDVFALFVLGLGEAANDRSAFIIEEGLTFIDHAGEFFFESIDGIHGGEGHCFAFGEFFIDLAGDDGFFDGRVLRSEAFGNFFTDSEVDGCHLDPFKEFVLETTIEGFFSVTALQVAHRRVISPALRQAAFGRVIIRIRY